MTPGELFYRRALTRRPDLVARALEAAQDVVLHGADPALAAFALKRLRHALGAIGDRMARQAAALCRELGLNPPDEQRPQGGA